MEQTQTPPNEAWDPDLIPLDPVKDLLVALEKALRAHRLYDENNPVYGRFVTSLEEALARVWGDTDTLQIQVEEYRLLFMGESVYQNDARSDSLAFIFWKDGIREILFEKGVEEELPAFLGALQRARTLDVDADDLLTVLWEADLSHFRYGYVDLLAEGTVLPEAGDTSQVDLSSVLDGEMGAELAVGGEEGEEGGENQASINPEDFNPTLYSLGPNEMEQLRNDIEAEMNRDLRSEVMAALFDRLEEPENPDRQSEIVEILHQWLPNLLSRGALISVGQILQQLTWARSVDGMLTDEGKEKVTAVIAEMSQSTSLVELVRALRDGTIAPDAQALAQLLRFLDPSALAPLLKLARESGETLRPVLREGVEGIARANPAYLGKLLGATDPVLVAESVLLIGRLGITKAIPAIGKLMAHGDARVRLACLDVMINLKATSLYSRIEELLTDPDRSVRIAAARAAGVVKHQAAVGWLRGAVMGKELKTADLSEKIAVFQAYGALAGPEAIEVLDDHLNGRGFLGRKESDETRACAALALGQIGNDQAREALAQARDEKSPIVRNAVRKALRPRDEAGRGQEA